LENWGEGMGKGLVIVLTGDGKGKTTSALGMALRAAGQGLKVLLLQFVKGGNLYGEHRALERIEGIHVRSLGLGMLLNSPHSLEEHREKAKVALGEARKAMLSGDCQMLIMDEVLFAVQAGLLEEEDVLGLIREKPEELHLVLTGRGATPAIVEAADTVTEMVSCKHHHEHVGAPVRGTDF